MVMSKLTSLVALVLLTLVSACASLPQREAVKPASVILVSIDAFRADYYDRGVTPNLKALADSGARAIMHPSFPSLTFPNHETLVTGLRPDEHGVIANKMFDPTHPATPGDPDPAHFGGAKASDGFWWEGATPVWVTAETRGLRTAAAYWPSSDAEIHGVRPSHWMPYKKSVTSAERVALILQWLDLPPEQRPAISLLYFDVVDTAGHDFGANSPELTAALQDVDGAIGQLRAGLAQRGIVANLVVVSDHGMTDISADRAYYVSNILGTDGLDPAAKKDPRFDFVNNGSVAMINPAPGYEAALDTALVKGHFDHMHCWHKGDIPAYLHFGHNRRVPEIVCLADLGWLIGDLPVNGPGYKFGAHGYDPAYPDMNAIFIANGPAFTAGTQLPAFDNVNVYDLEMRLLRLKPLANDGSLTPVLPALKPEVARPRELR